MASDKCLFLEPGLRTHAGKLAIVSLARDDFAPINVQDSSGAVDGYAEGAVLNTRFGSFPHSTLLDIPWGSQVRASAVDTGSRGRKRRLETDDDTPAASQDDTDKSNKRPAKKAIAASSGFIYILRPSPELWTSSLPHRTQVVYTPDYSYVLQRVMARPGSRLIEAGAGSGSFTHASVRAVWNGYPKNENDTRGKVFSFEYDEARYHAMTEEIKDHSLSKMVHITHRDVYKEGFNVDGKSPLATAVFLDLPAPWKALHHLSRRKPTVEGEQEASTDDGSWVSPLDPNQTAHICTFSPCIEQVSRTVNELRKLGWVDVAMVEIANRRYNVNRERVGIDLPNERGNTQSPADVSEAISKLQKVSKRSQEFHKLQAAKVGAAGGDMDLDTPENGSKAASPQREADKPWLTGKLVTRPEADIKTHTSYLVFATLPREWSEEQEAAALAKWPCGQEKGTIGNVTKADRKEEKRRMLEPKKRRKGDNDTQ